MRTLSKGVATALGVGIIIMGLFALLHSYETRESYWLMAGLALCAVGWFVVP